MSSIAGWKFSHWCLSLLEASLSDASCWVGVSLAMETWGSGVPGDGDLGVGIPWRWRPGCLLAVPHCLVAPTHTHRLAHHACDTNDGTLCAGCCSDMRRRNDLSPSTWNTLFAVGRMFLVIHARCESPDLYCSLQGPVRDIEEHKSRTSQESCQFPVLISDLFVYQR